MAPPSMTAKTTPLQAGITMFGHYMSLIDTTDIVAALQSQGEDTRSFFLSLGEARGNYAYAPGKWTLKEVIGHLNDAERVFAYRALRFARKDSTPLHSFAEDEYVANANFTSLLMSNLVEEHYLIRQSNILLFRSLNNEVLERKGISGTTELTVKNILYIIAGHEQHHLDVIRERYMALNI